MQVSLLGPLEVHDDAGRLVDIAGARLRSLLVCLAVDAGRPVSMPALVDAVWGDQPPAEAANALQTLVSRLRRALADGGKVAQSAAGYRLVADREDIDAFRFERLAAAGAASLRGNDPQAAAVQLGEALALWRGPALADAGDSVATVALRLQDLRHAAVLDRIEADLALGRAAGVVAELEALAAERPLDERLAGQLITALAAVGRQADALTQYELVRGRLADELGMDPSADLRAVQLAVLRGQHTAPAAKQRRTNLRAELTTFVGRDVEVARIGKSLEEYRLVTLVGPGGAGKTRLAGEAVARIVDSVPDGVWFVELASVTDAADLPQTVSGSLGLRETHLLDRQQLTARDALSRLLEGLADKNMVLVLDNCEHLIEGAARLADTLLAQCPQLRVLATSREPLGIYGESLFVVPPLGQPESGASAAEALEYPAVRLFADRAAAVRPEFVLDQTTVAVVVDIVRRLDGLPLAIELAAARLRSLPIAEIAARLSDRFRLLTGGSRTALPRHRTLRAVVEWSWDLLEDAERTLAERFGVFPAGAATDAAAEVCSGGDVAADDVTELIASLVDKSLLQPVADGARFRMLETIREYGLERVAERGELESLRARHAEYFSELMRVAEPHLIRREQLDWLAVIAAERDNILGALRFWCDTANADAALALAVSMSSLAMLLGNHADVAVWVAEALDVPGGEPGLRAVGEALYALNSATTDVRSSAEEIEQNMDRMATLLDRLEDVDLVAYPMAALMRPAVAIFAGNDELTTRWVDLALAAPDPWVSAAVRMFRANIAENNGDIEGLRADTAIALRQFRELGERWGLGSTLRTLAVIHTLDGDLDAAEAAYIESLDVMHEMGSREDEAFLRVRLADIAARRGDLGRARELLRAAEESTEASGMNMEAVFTLSMYAEVERLDGNLAEARRLHDRARLRFEAIPPVHPIQGHASAMIHGLASALACTEGRLEVALSSARTSYAAAISTKDLPIVSMCGIATAGVAAAMGLPADAAQILGACVAVRGADDPTDVGIKDLTAQLIEALGPTRFAAEYAVGRALDRQAALGRLDPNTFASPA